MGNTRIVALAMAALLMPLASAGAQTAAGYAIQTGQSINTGAHLPTLQPPSNMADSHPASIAIPATASVKAPRTRRHKVVDDSEQADDDSSPTDNWVEVK